MHAAAGKAPESCPTSLLFLSHQADLLLSSVTTHQKYFCSSNPVLGLICMQIRNVASVYREYDLQQMFEPPASTEVQQVLQSGNVSRIHWDLDGFATLLLDEFPETKGTSCCFFRLGENDAFTVRFTAQGEYQLISCPSGGWMIKPAKTTLPSYWLPKAPRLRIHDPSGRILSEESPVIVGFEATSTNLAIEIETSGNMQLDLTLWRFPPGKARILGELEQPLVLEKQPVFLWTSQTVYREPADVYLYLIHGHVYANRFIWPRKWKICSELDAYGLYVLLNGLELATNKELYGLLKRQLLFSVIARQSPDGGWYHGEWTDSVESHYRYHNGAIHLLESALEETPDDTVRTALECAAAFISNYTDQTSLGLWFLHDSLEESTDGMDECWKQTGGKWLPSRILGKSPTNKLILNTHLDTTIALHRYSEVTGDNRYAKHVDSAHSAACSALMLHPAEQLYRLAYRAIGLTLLPLSEAKGLSLPVRAIKRLTANYLIPQLHRIKRMFPRFVMPGGLIERHLSPLHFNIQYHAVNTMDLARLLHCFPSDGLMDILDNAVTFVADNNILKYWSESKPRQYALVVWVDALYRVCILNQQGKYRAHLAEAIMFTEDAGLGLPPAVLGTESEMISRSEQKPCPSPTDARLRVVNLSCSDHMELLVINNTSCDLELEWEENKNLGLSWLTDAGKSVPFDNSPLYISARGWLRGQEDG
jgi:hypothetical protein